MATTNHRLVATIAAGASLSPVLSTGGYPPVALRLPAGGWTTAAISFDASEDGTDFGAVFDLDGRELSITIAAGRYVALPTAPFAGSRYIRVRSGLVGAPVTQIQAQDIIVVIAPDGGVSRLA